MSVQGVLWCLLVMSAEVEDRESVFLAGLGCAGYFLHLGEKGVLSTIEPVICGR